jgi:hypothetical protein
MALFDAVWEFIKNTINLVLDASYEKVAIINGLNKSFDEQFHNGETNRLVKVSITIGDSSYKHSMSVNFTRSGFMMMIQNDEALRLSEVNEVAQYILTNDYFVKKLMSLGFDTLIVKGKSTNSIKFKLSEYANLDNYFLK